MINRHTEVRKCKTVVVDSVTCDLCKAVFEKANGRESTIDWEGDAYHSTETTVSYKELSHYPGDCWVDRLIAVHLCPVCFLERLVPWLREQGADVRSEYDL